MDIFLFWEVQNSGDFLLAENFKLFRLEQYHPLCPIGDCVRSLYALQTEHLLPLCYWKKQTGMFILFFFCSILAQFRLSKFYSLIRHNEDWTDESEFKCWILTHRRMQTQQMILDDFVRIEWVVREILSQSNVCVRMMWMPTRKYILCIRNWVCIFIIKLEFCYLVCRIFLICFWMFIEDLLSCEVFEATTHMLRIEQAGTPFHV